MEASSIAAVEKVRGAVSSEGSRLGGSSTQQGFTMPPDVREKFAALMERHSQAPQHGGSREGVNAATRLLEGQQAEINSLYDRSFDTLASMRGMDIEEMVVASASLSMQASMMHVKLAATEGVTRASNKSLQSLLKNE
jgi:hypothetical protein